MVQLDEFMQFIHSDSDLIIDLIMDLKEKIFCLKRENLSFSILKKYVPTKSISDIKHEHFLISEMARKMAYKFIWPLITQGF